MHNVVDVCNFFLIYIFQVLVNQDIFALQLCQVHNVVN